MVVPPCPPKEGSASLPSKGGCGLPVLQRRVRPPCAPKEGSASLCSKGGFGLPVLQRRV